MDEFAAMNGTVKALDKVFKVVKAQKGKIDGVENVLSAWANGDSEVVYSDREALKAISDLINPLWFQFRIAHEMQESDKDGEVEEAMDEYGPTEEIIGEPSGIEEFKWFNRDLIDDGDGDQDGCS